MNPDNWAAELARLVDEAGFVRQFTGRNVDPQRGGLQIHTTEEEGVTMSPFETDPRSELEKQRDELESQLARLTRKLSALEELPDLDASLDESVILWKRRYRNEDTVYTYVALKQGGVWYLTAQRSAALSSAELAEKHLIHAVEVWVAAGWVTPTPGEPVPVYSTE